MRQEACHGLYKLCIGNTSRGRTGYAFLLPVLSSLLRFLETAQNMRTPRKRVSSATLVTVHAATIKML